MDSQATLINVPPPYTFLPQPPAGHTILDFDLDNMNNTVITYRGTGRRAYAVESNALATKTRIYRYQDEGGPVLIASVERNNVGPDRIQFEGSARAMRVGQWLKSPALSSL